MQKIVIVMFFPVLSGLTRAQATPASELHDKIDVIVRQVLSTIGVPSASVAIVQEGRVTYIQAYGEARLKPRVFAKPEMRYCIGSISKQFAAAAMLMLAEEGKLSLDDPVARFLPDLTRSKEVTIRQVLSHTAGYQDYWPQDYVPPFMQEPVSAEQILDRWARKPLDFDPGTQWQYSNTGFVIAGLIIEKASGQPLFEFLQQRIFNPLGMKTVINVDQEELTESDARGYTRSGLTSPRPAPKEGKGWLFAACGLAMTAEDLAKWDISLMNQSLLKAASYREMQSVVVLKNGLSSGYGLGVGIGRRFGSRSITHAGEISGFIAQNLTFPDDRAAVVVLTNDDAVDATTEISQKIASLLVSGKKAAKEEQQAGNILLDLQRGKIDRDLFSENGNFIFSEEMVQNLAKDLKRLGKMQALTQSGMEERGGMTRRRFSVTFPRKNLAVTQLSLPDGRIEQFLISLSP